MNKKLLQINVTANIGSTGYIAEQINIHAQEEGWETYIAYGRAAKNSACQLIKVGNKLQVYEHYAENVLFDREGLSSRMATKHLVDKIKKIHPDIIHLHNIHDHWLNYEILFEYLNNSSIPIVWTFHDCWAFTGHCSHFVTIECDKWETGCFSCPLKKSHPRSIFFDRSEVNYNLKKRLFSQNKNIHLVLVSHWLEGLVKLSFFKDKDIMVIHNGINLKVFKPYEVLSGDRFKILGVASVWSASKGLSDFYKLRRLLDINEYEITLIGLNDKQLKNMPDGIHGIKKTDTINDLAMYYSTADVFVNLTYADSFPTVNLEALACGTPVITYNTGGSPEAITQETGWVVEQGDIVGVANIIKRFESQSKQEINRRRLACRERAETHFNQEKNFNRYLKLYYDILS